MKVEIIIIIITSAVLYSSTMEDEAMAKSNEDCHKNPYFTVYVYNLEFLYLQLLWQWQFLTSFIKNIYSLTF